MVWFILTQLFSILIQLIRIGRMSDHEKDLEILILHYQLDMAELHPSVDVIKRLNEREAERDTIQRATDQ